MEESDLFERWEGFQLTGVEKEVVILSDDAIKHSEIRGKHCLLCFIVSEKWINREAFRNTTSLVWKLTWWVTFNEVGGFKFLVEFQNQSDMEKILCSRP